VVCGGFALPIRRGYATEVYIVTSGELMSLYSTNNICNAINTMNELQDVKVKVGGLINNMRGIPNEQELVEEFSKMIGVSVIANIPRSPIIQQSEVRKGPVVEHFPDSDVAERFRELAKTLCEPKGVFPEPMDPKESIGKISGLLRKYQVFV
jgi:nitrogenase iron protein NifH